eukprot:RCo011468
MASRMMLFFSAFGLRDADVVSKSDPYLTLFEIQDGRRVLLGRTETIPNNLSPQWKRHIEIDYRFESRQELVAVLMDDDGKGPMGDDTLGSVDFLLAHVVSGRGGRCEKLVQAPGKGRLLISSQPASTAGEDSVVLKFSGTGLKKMDTFGTADPYFKLFRILPTGSHKLLCRSRVIKKSLDPHWMACPPLKIAELAGGDLDAKTILFECWDKDMIIDDSMGQFTTSVNELIRSVGKPEGFTLRHATKEKFYGRIMVEEASVHHVPTFSEYLAAGLRLNVAVAIDFTASNGDPRDPQSLHFMNPNAPNQYVQSLKAVCEIVLDYDTDKFVPAMGFGANLPKSADGGGISHCFNLNGTADPYVRDVQGVLDAYTATLNKVTLSGPTNFAPVIRKAADAARESGHCLEYQILLILTDGAITDTDATIDAIVAASELGLSIIIIGVGQADFSTMAMLDGDNARLVDSKGRPAARDIVQFVPFRDFAQGPVQSLAAEVLREVPRQVQAWAMSTGLTLEKISELRS